MVRQERTSWALIPVLDALRHPGLGQKAQGRGANAGGGAGLISSAGGGPRGPQMPEIVRARPLLRDLSAPVRSALQYMTRQLRQPDHAERPVEGQRADALADDPCLPQGAWDHAACLADPAAGRARHRSPGARGTDRERRVRSRLRRSDAFHPPLQARPRRDAGTLPAREPAPPIGIA